MNCGNIAGLVIRSRSALFTTGVLTLLISIGCRRTTGEHKKQELILKAAQLDIDSFIGACEQYRKDNGSLPDGPKGLYGKDEYLIQQRVVDPWGNNYKYTFSTNGVAMESAGPDRQWGTADDLRRESPAK